MRKLSLLALVLGFAAAGCRGDSGDDAPGIDSGSNNNNDVTIQEIQDPAMTNGTPVTVKGVVVTAIDAYGAKTGDFWVQEPGGGEFSGIHVFGAPLDQVAALAIGDVVDIDGAEKDDFMYSDFDPGYAITELKPLSGGEMSVTKTGANMVLQPQLVNALQIGALPTEEERLAEWEKWEGVLIRVENVLASGNQDCVGSACNDPTLQKIGVTGQLVIESALAPFPVDSETMFANAWKQGDCLTGATGVLDYFFDYLLLPRTTAEYGTEGTGCPKEDTVALCGDGMDNDGNGFMDCEDNACVVANSACRTEKTIAEIQAGAATITGGVELKDVCVSALGRATGSGTPTPKNLWVQTANGAATTDNGLYVRGDGSDYSAFTAGKKVDIIGTVREFDGSSMTGTGTLTQMNALKVTVVAGTCNPAPVTASQTAAVLTVDVTGEPFESVLVNLENVKITTAATNGSFYVGTMEQAGTSFKFDDDIFQNTAAATTCYDNIAGIWSYNTFDNYWVFFPLDAGDTTGGVCP